MLLLIAMPVVPVSAAAAPDDKLRAALRRENIIDADPALSTVRRLCTLRVATQRLVAVDVIIRIPLEQAPRLYRRVFVLDQQLRPLSTMTYFLPARALPCGGDVLRFSTPVEVDNTLPEGRRVRVVEQGRKLVVIPPFTRQ